MNTRMNTMKLMNNHRLLFGSAFLLFVGLSLVVAIVPALENQANNAPLPSARPLSEYEAAGKNVYIANGCVGCHTQQVRAADMDKVWGKRPAVPADYAMNTRIDLWRNTATLMGTQRTGPDLTNIGNRQPSRDWHLLHLYNPRAVVGKSVMAAYPWMFEEKDAVYAGDVIVNVPNEWKRDTAKHVIAREEALHLVAYLLSLQQAPLPDGISEPKFLFKPPPKPVAAAINGVAASSFDGAALYAANCQSCHQANGEGLKGAFPPLKGSSVVLDDKAELMVNIIMNGYNAHEEYGVMLGVGTMNALSAGEVAAIMNHERTSWGNAARKVTENEVKTLMETVKKPQ
jgi:cytochrome c oxidase cbb3-type subunit II